MSDSIVEDARGRWPGLLKHFGIDVPLRRSCPCPACGGSDRFTFDDKEGLGTYVCRGCGAGTGFKLLAACMGWTQSQAMGEVRKVIGGIEKVEPKQEMTDEQRKKLLNETWSGGIELKGSDPASKYLFTRTGLKEFPKSLRYHGNLLNVETGANMAALIAKVTDADNKPVAIHRTYLYPDGEKAKLERNKMLIGSMPEGSAIRLMPYEEEIGIAEGIETAISAFAIFGIPTWAAVTAGGLEKWKPPEICKRIWVFGDNDKKFTGQLAAYRLAWKLCQMDRYEKVGVMIPDIIGADWNDVLTLLGSVEAREKYRLS